MINPTKVIVYVAPARTWLPFVDEDGVNDALDLSKPMRLVAERDYAKLAHGYATLRAERDALRTACEALPKAMDRAMNYIAWEVSACNGLKCREGHCASCCGDEEAEAWVAKARASYADLKHAAAALDAALAVQPTTGAAHE